jgi:hypothetical protein
MAMLLAGGVAISAGAADVRFNRDIRPIMSDTCFHCHGPDAKSRKGGLRLDLREEALKAAKSGEIPIVPGKPDQSEIIKRIAQYELAFKMQSSVPDLTDFSKEPKEMLDLYGIKEPGDGSFASNCLLARRLAERGVRMIQLYHRAWDHHASLVDGMKWGAEDVDKASAALIKDLKQRGMLDDTLIL